MANPIGRNRRRDAVDAEADRYETGPRLPDGLTRWTMYVMSRAAQRGLVLLNDKLAGSGLSPRLHALLVVAREQGPVSQQTISEVLRVDRTTVDTLADAAETAGHIVRDRDRADRRRYSVNLTESGARVLDQGDRLVAEAHDQLLAGLDDAERAALHALLSRLVPAAS